MSELENEKPEFNEEFDAIVYAKESILPIEDLFATGLNIHNAFVAMINKINDILNCSETEHYQIESYSYIEHNILNNKCYILTPKNYTQKIIAFNLLNNQYKIVEQINNLESIFISRNLKLSCYFDYEVENSLFVVIYIQTF